MSDFDTAFQITSGNNGVLGDMLFRLFIGVAALVVGVRAMIGARRKEGITSWIAPVFTLAWSLAWLYLHNFPRAFGHINSLVSAYRDGRYQVVEGPVQVLHTQPATGHTKGDVIAVNGKQFEVNYFYATPAYCKTLAHGGVLRAGSYARIYYYNDEILRVDMRK